MLSIDNKQIMIEQYQKILLLTNTKIIIKMKAYTLTINGEQLQSIALDKDDLLMEGKVLELQFVYE
ncbi:MAG: YabP/YqfC family sporulation protein [Longicatena sp.]